MWPKPQKPKHPIATITTLIYHVSLFQQLKALRENINLNCFVRQNHQPYPTFMGGANMPGLSANSPNGMSLLTC